MMFYILIPSTSKQTNKNEKNESNLHSGYESITG